MAKGEVLVRSQDGSDICQILTGVCSKEGGSYGYGAIGKILVTR